MNDSVLAVSDPNPQATDRAPVLMPALVDMAFDYLVPEGTAQGALVEATLAGRALVGVVWAAPLSGESLRSAMREPQSEERGALASQRGLGAMPPSVKKAFKLKPIKRVIENLPPLTKSFRDWLDWVSDFTLAPKGAVLSLCGLAHAAKTTRKKFEATPFTIALPTLTRDQQAAADSLCAMVEGANPSPLRGEDGWGADMRKGHPRKPMRDFARALRMEMTDAETKLWRTLRHEQLGVKFRKQHPIGSYIADFACLAPKIILELDGGQHADDVAITQDKARTISLESQGFTVLRFWNNEVLQAMDGVLAAIQSAIACPPNPHPNPPPEGAGVPRSTLAPKPILLDGVTGSGKTEVYFHAIAAALGQHTPQMEGAVRSASEPRSGEGLGAMPPSVTEIETVRSVSEQRSGEGLGAMPPFGAHALNQILIMLPEIALTHQWLARFEKTFGAAPVVWHSRMTPAAKARAWQAVARGEAPVVVGARSALFLPFANLRLIIVDEEHDPSYKQEEGVLYHARDIAVMRARFEKIPIVLASATPSLETMENVREGKYHALRLPKRFGAAGLPDVELVDMRNDPPERGDFISPRVKQAMLETLGRGEQVLFFLNRRGYAPLLLCRGCGHRFECSHCSAWLVVHGSKSMEGGITPYAPNGADPLPSGSPSATHARYRAQLHCHHCGHREPMPKACPTCNADADKLAPCGPGVERIAEEVRAMFANSSPQRGEVGRGAFERKGHPLEKTLQHARDLRKELTEAEKRLWQLLRQESLGIKFRKQHPIGPYIVDFAAYEPKLIVELDGGQHATPDAIAYDHQRTEFLQQQGFAILRFWNNEMLENSEAVLTKIVEMAQSISPHPNSPPEGEGTPKLAVLSSDEAVTPATWAAIESGEIDILVGTQMVAKGHHFPRLTLVVVVDADVGLDGADLRAGERSYQLLHQLGGRAGRDDKIGTVLVQTYAPEHPVMKALVAHDRNRLMALEAAERKAGGWPPFGQLAAIVLDGAQEATVKAAGQALARSAPMDDRLTVLGPAAAPLSKLRGQYRYRLLVKAKTGIHLQRTLRNWLQGKTFKGVRIKVDVNPYYFM